MKKKALAVLLTASVIAGTMGGTATIVHADEEGKVINISGMMNSVSVWKQYILK